MRFSGGVKWLAAGVCAVFLAHQAQASNPLQIKTDRGKILGKKSADGQVREFLGVPFAAPPVGPLRWKPPQPAAKWHGVRSATAFGNRCMQQPIYSDMVFRDPGNSEDCLTLNIWTTAKDKKAKQPVMVWIFGGGYTAGGTSEPRQDGEHLAEKGVVVVSMNYRLGIFGFFATSDLASESPHKAAGNYGLLDQWAAIEWVHKNIAAFGGDPANVTIFGESAGSFSVSAQMASPLAQGLFVHAIGESGAAFGSRALSFPTLADLERKDETFALAAFGSTSLSKLRSESAEDVLKAAGAVKERIFTPDVDGYFLPESVPAIFAEGKQAHIPLLAGWNKNEGGTAPTTVEELRVIAVTDFAGDTEEFFELYPARTDDEASLSAGDYRGDRFIAYSTWAWLEAQANGGSTSVYRYRFDLGSPGDLHHSAALGAFHSDDIEYVFGNLDSRQGAVWRPEDRKLSALMQSYWTNFARTGDPNGAGLPNWPTYNAADHWQVMHLDPQPAARPDAHRARYLFLQRRWSHKSGT